MFLCCPSVTFLSRTEENILHAIIKFHPRVHSQIIQGRIWVRSSPSTFYQVIGTQERWQDGWAKSSEDFALCCRIAIIIAHHLHWT